MFAFNALVMFTISLKNKPKKKKKAFIKSVKILYHFQRILKTHNFLHVFHLITIQRQGKEPCLA